MSALLEAVGGQEVALVAVADGGERQATVSDIAVDGAAARGHRCLTVQHDSVVDLADRTSREQQHNNGRDLAHAHSPFLYGGFGSFSAARRPAKKANEPRFQLSFETCFGSSRYDQFLSGSVP